jgi:hypothetical protein
VTVGVLFVVWGGVLGLNVFYATGLQTNLVRTIFWHESMFKSKKAYWEYSCSLLERRKGTGARFKHAGCGFLFGTIVDRFKILKPL